MSKHQSAEDPSTKELNQFVQNMLKQMQERFEDMSKNIVARVDEMGILCKRQANALTTSNPPSDKS